MPGRGLRILLVAVGYFALGAWTLATIATVSPYVAPLWRPTGWAIAALLLGGLPCWPGIFAGAAAVNGYASASALVACGILEGAGLLLSASVASALLFFGTPDSMPGGEKP